MLYKKRVSTGVYWVPAEILGERTCTDDDIKKVISQYNLETIKLNINSLVDALRFFEIIKYSECDDTISIEENGILWEHHSPLENMLKTKKGNCATAAAWLVEMLKHRYEDVSMVLIFRYNETGHVINMIKYKKKFYFIDMYMHMVEFLKYLPPETGRLMDFAKQKYITSMIYMTESLEAFTMFYSRFMRNQIHDHLYIHLATDIVPPIASRKIGNDVILYIHSDYVNTVINHSKYMRWDGSKQTTASII